MKLKTRALVFRALEEGLSYGLRRTYKYVDAPLGLDDWNEARQADLLEHLIGALDEIVAEWDPTERGCAR